MANKKRLPAHFKLLFSEGSPWVEAFLTRKARTLPKSEALVVSKKLYKEIQKVNEEIIKYDLPSHLQLAYVHPQVKTGVFLKHDEKPLKMGSFIGIYTGRYELVESTITTGTSYAYDVAQAIHLSTKDLLHVTKVGNEQLSTKAEYSIQTNALPQGNFTRFINHSSLEPNVEAIVSKLPNNRIEILLFALKDINPGEQLLSNYGGLYWKALDVIPNDMKPTTYLLNPLGKAVLKEKRQIIPPTIKKKLLPLRNPVPQLPDELAKESILKKYKKTLPLLSKKRAQEKENFEEIVLERGLPRYLTLKTSEGIYIPRANGDKLEKNRFVGVLAGTFSLKGNKHSLLIAKMGKKSLFLQLDKEGNFLSELPILDEGNLKIELYYDPEQDLIYPLLLTKKEIGPGEKLLLAGNHRKIPLL